MIGGKGMNKAKYVAVLACSMALLLFTAVSYAEDLTGFERGVCQDIIERWHQALYDRGGDFEQASKDLEWIYQQVAGKYNISVDEVKKIDGKGITVEPSDQDYKIYDALTKALNSLPQGSNSADSERVHADIANQYGISFYKLHEIEYQMYEGMWDWF